MVFNQGELTWTCHICERERPDAKISVVSKPLIINGKTVGQQNIHYCNDNPECAAAAAEYSFIKEG
ncbi:hypothetical protein ES703_56491 [subsurface metagenome]